MAKTTGGVRTYNSNTKTYRNRLKEVEEMMNSGEYSSVEMGKGGGYLAIQKSKARHKHEEIEAATILSNKGYKVILKDEAGQVKTPDGYLFAASFEQKTPSVGGSKGVKNNLEHAKIKGADIAVIYDKNHVYNRAEVDKGLRMYEILNKYRFKGIIVIDSGGKIHRHKHNG
jgi:hypothetical protein